MRSILNFGLIVCLLISLLVTVGGADCADGDCHSSMANHTITDQMSILSESAILLERGYWAGNEQFSGSYTDSNKTIDRAYRYTQTGMGALAYESSTQTNPTKISTDKTQFFNGSVIVDEETTANQEVCSPGDIIDDGDDDDEEGFNLTVYVKNSDDLTAIHNADVDLSPGGSLSTDSEGVVYFKGISAGTYSVTADASGYDADSLSVNLDDDETVTLYLDPNEEDDDGDFNLTIYVKDADTSAPINNAAVSVSPGGKTRTDTEGYCKFLKLSERTYTVTADADDYSSDSLSVNLDDDETVTLYLESDDDDDDGENNLTVYVKDSDTLDPIEDAIVDLSPGASILTDEDGYCKFINLEDGTYNVSADADEYASDSLSIVLSNDKTVTLYLDPNGDDDEEEGYNLTVYVKNSEDDSAIEDATVDLSPGASILTDEDGYCRFLKLSERTYTVTADADGYDADSLTINLDDDEIVTLYLDPSDDDEHDLTVYVRDSDSYDLIKGATVTLVSGVKLLTGSNGKVIFADLDDGTYTIKAKKSGYGSDSITKKISKDTSVTLYLDPDGDDDDDDDDDDLGICTWCPLETADYDSDSSDDDDSHDLTVYVKDSDDFAVIGDATVDISPGSSTETNSNGRAKFYDLDEDTYEVFVEADGYESDSETVYLYDDRTITIYLDPESDDDDTDDGDGYDLTVYVKDSDDQDPIEDAIVDLSPGSSTETNSNGRVKFYNLDEDTYEISVEADGYESESRTVSLSKDKTIIIYLDTEDDDGDDDDTHDLTVYVKDSDTLDPIEDATVDLSPGGTSLTSSTGKVKFSELDDDTYEISVDADGYESDSITISLYNDKTVTIYLDSEEGDDDSDSYDLTVYVKDSDTLEPIEDAIVDLSPGSSTETNSNGRVKFYDLDEDTYEISAEANGYESDSLSLYIEDDEIVTLYLDPEGSDDDDVNNLTVFVLNSDDLEPIEDATVDLSPGPSTETNSDGQVKFYDLDTGTYTVSAEAIGFEEDSITINLEGDKIVTLYLDPEDTNEETYDLTIYVLDKMDLTVIGGATIDLSPGVSTITDSNGVTVYEDLDPGTYKVSGEADGYEDDYLSVNLDDDEIVTLYLAPEGSDTDDDIDLTVYVRDENTNVGIGGASVTLDPGFTSLTNAAGVVIFQDLEERTYNVSANASGYDTDSLSINLDDDEKVTLYLESDDIEDTTPDLTAPTQQSLQASTVLMGQVGGYKSSTTLELTGSKTILYSGQQQVSGPNGSGLYEGSAKTSFTSSETQTTESASLNTDYRISDFLVGKFAIDQAIKTPKGFSVS